MESFSLEIRFFWGESDELEKVCLKLISSDHTRHRFLLYSLLNEIRNTECTLNRALFGDCNYDLLCTLTLHSISLLMDKYSINIITHSNE